MSKYQNPKFDKEKYWKRRENVVKEKVPDGDKVKKDGTPKMKTIETVKPLRGQGDTPSRIVGYKPSDVTIGFSNDGKLVVQNRAWRRTPVKLDDEKPTKMKSKRKKKK